MIIELDPQHALAIARLVGHLLREADGEEHGEDGDQLLRDADAGFCTICRALVAEGLLPEPEASQ